MLYDFNSNLYKIISNSST